MSQPETVSEDEAAQLRGQVAKLMRYAMFAADDAAINALSQSFRNGEGPTKHQIVKAAVKAALDLVIGCKLATVAPEETWPIWIPVNPPSYMSEPAPGNGTEPTGNDR